MAPQQKGKQGTKGAKQIAEENVATLKFYRNLASGGTFVYIVATFLLFDLTWFSITMSVFVVAVLFGSYQTMLYMLKDNSCDLNMEGGFGEHVKDLIILTVGTELLSLYSDWMWLLLLLGPGRLIYMLWGSVIKPWLDQKNEQQQPDVDDKKQRKLDKKMKRMR